MPYQHTSFHDVRAIRIERGAGDQHEWLNLILVGSDGREHTVAAHANTGLPVIDDRTAQPEPHLIGGV